MIRRRSLGTTRINSTPTPSRAQTFWSGVAASRERKWKHRTINDAIDEAFARLTKRGILALQNVGGTHATAWAEVLAEIDRRATRARNTLGGTYFHSQDTERGIAGQGLSLGFGAVNGEPDDDLKIARAVVTALRDEGVAYEWDGSRDTRVRILPFEWRKRRTTRPPPRQPPVAWQTYVHPDGRTWSVAGLNNHVHIRIGYPDGEVVERRTPDPNLAGAIAALVESQQADGFERSEVESKLRLL